MHLLFFEGEGGWVGVVVQGRHFMLGFFNYYVDSFQVVEPSPLPTYNILCIYNLSYLSKDKARLMMNDKTIQQQVVSNYASTSHDDQGM